MNGAQLLKAHGDSSGTMTGPPAVQTSPTLADDSLEFPNNLSCLPVKAIESRDYFRIVESCSLAERYLENDLSVILELAPKRHGFPVGVRASENNCIAVNRSVFALQFYALNPSYSKHWDQEMVLVVNVESMDGANIRVPSLTLIRFHVFDQEVEQTRSGIYPSCTGE